MRAVTPLMLMFSSKTQSALVRLRSSARMPDTVASATNKSRIFFMICVMVYRVIIECFWLITTKFYNISKKNLIFVQLFGEGVASNA